MRWKIDTAGMQYKTTEARIITAGRYGMGRYSERLRDEARKEYGRLTHRSIYGNKSVIGGIDDSRSLANFIVSAPTDGGDAYRIGSKKGAVLQNGNGKNMKVEEIFSIMEKGVRPRKYWRFKLPTTRQGASEDGYWMVNKLPARPFMKNTYKRAKKEKLGMTELQKDFHSKFMESFGGK